MIFLINYWLYKLVVGDINQDVLNLNTNDNLVQLCKSIGECDILKLSKSYRSSYEISKFCQKIKGLKYDVIDRHGKTVEILKFENERQEVNKIIELLKEASQKRVAIICKTKNEADKYYQLLKDRVEITLVDSDLDISADRIIISSASSKGVEFDVVIIPNVTTKIILITWIKFYISPQQEHYMNCI